MWNFSFQREATGELPEPASNRRERARRFRRPAFAGAESLESRALLSAAGIDAPIESFDVIDLVNQLPPTPADISLIDAENLKSSFGTAASGFTDGGSHSLGNRFGEFADSSGLSDQVFASLGQDSQRPLAAIAISGSHDSTQSLSPSGDSELRVELRVAQTGQLITAGSANSVQDSNGLTINDDSGPTTYLRTTDLLGRVHSQLAFVTRTVRTRPVVEPQAAMTAHEAVIAQADISDEAVTAEIVARPDLHDFETALDVAGQSESPTFRQDDSPQSLAAASRTRWATPARSDGANETELTAAGNDRRAAATGLSVSLAAGKGEFGTDSEASAALPAFDPTTRNVVLSVFFLGSLARATARRRRRLKAAIAQ